MRAQHTVPREDGTVRTPDGAGLRVVESGPTDAAATLVLVHGWTQDDRTWDAVRSELAARFPAVTAELRVLRYDLRGHGGSDPAGAGTATIEQLADDLAGVLRSRAPSGPVVLVGHSMGGMTIMTLVARHPGLVRERVAGAVFVATACDGMDHITLGLPGAAGRAASRAARRMGNSLTRMRRERVPLRPALARSGARALVFGKRPDSDDVALVAAQLMQANPADLGRFQQSIATHDQRAALTRLREVPTAVLAGERDRLCPIERAEAIVARLPEADYVRFPGAGHMLPQERSSGVAARIVDVLRRATHGV